MDENGYQGPAELIAGAERVPVTVTLAGHFDPITGKYAWYGRVAASRQVAAMVGAGGRRVVLRTPEGSAETALTDVDPWGRPRVSSFGAPPFAVQTDLAQTDLAE